MLGDFNLIQPLGFSCGHHNHCGFPYLALLSNSCAVPLVLLDLKDTSKSYTTSLLIDLIESEICGQRLADYQNSLHADSLYKDITSS